MALHIDLLGKRDYGPGYDGFLLLLHFALGNLLFYERKQFRQINIHRLNFTFFEVPRDLCTNDTLSHLPRINLYSPLAIISLTCLTFAARSPSPLRASGSVILCGSRAFWR